jgi:Protein of unknown function (DUF2785)
MKQKCTAVMTTLLLAGIGLGAVSAFPAGLAPEKALHDREFWRAIAKSHYSVPQGQQVSALARELSGYLGSPDPELRDDLAYSILDAWIVHGNQFSGTELTSLKSEWEVNLQAGIGEAGTDSVFRRSFSALCLATLAERDLKSTFLNEADYHKLLDHALTYLQEERDLRGFDSVKGWIHTTAHTADLLAALAANPRFKIDDQRRMLHAISQRLSSARQIFSYGEQDRLAIAVSAIVSRKDFNSSGFQSWLTTLDETDRKVWKDSPPNGDLLKTFQNNSYLLQALAARLCAKPKTPEIGMALDQVTEILRKR